MYKKKEYTITAETHTWHFQFFTAKQRTTHNTKYVIH